jgi:hypothetical protein
MSLVDTTTSIFYLTINLVTFIMTSSLFSSLFYNNTKIGSLSCGKEK